MALHKPYPENSLHELHAGEQHILPSRRIFVNRNLKMESVRMMGFDMDHTLAVYRDEPTEALAFNATRDKLIEEKGYPDSIRVLRYDPDLIIRGLVVDKRLGNILKIDQYNYVVRVYHGTTKVPKQVRRRVYRNSRIRLSSDKYMSIDTLFGLPEATLFAQLVDHIEEREGRRRRDYTEVYNDVRECIDRAHADGTIKRQILAAPERFLVKDPELPQTLQEFKDHGTELFLLTNSEPDYTHRVMEFLLDATSDAYPRWHHYFDKIVVNAGKPRFFRSTAKPRVLPPKEVTAAGMDPELSTKVYEGGGAGAFEALVGYEGDEILYVGDHTFGDILRAKEHSRWRTAMVVQELEREMEREQELQQQYRNLDSLVAERRRLLSRIARVRHQLQEVRRTAHGAASAGSGVLDPVRELEERLQRLVEEGVRSAGTIRQRRDEVEGCFNKHWGKLFKCGEVNSRFGHQVKVFACIYTSAVRNFKAYPVSMYFRSPREIMPHELGSERA
ncbi:MAG: HAD-IG family 5'-nucleotidase [Candidatus Latescibacterota bacterium]|nr:MAG: HAD-IG family 5'-nucleotidase [Candidatus Latescibacterota bacterium]